ncbi:PhoD-like phosphatase-domain-containing protein [Multifurca ochricompacta]|uniref:PhoD-like phosphatase-domain-containing protein n=1 Tax=Multifurca ochricompacta TaxID=376703 RepID=A0AAD4QM23_9AGAM|nr:PhoD-like phosphatase-domain-containing protein [Multifurca ochricompacta]
MTGSRSKASYAGAIFSTLFRLFTYVFLRVIPIRWCKYLIPAFYLAYAVTIPFTRPLSPQSPSPSPPSTPEDNKQGSNAAKDESNNDFLWELLFSLPTTRVASIITWSINTLLIVFAADFVFTPLIDSAADVTFTRVGAVYPDSVKVIVRYPLIDHNATEHNVRILWRPATAADVEPWTDGPVLRLDPEFDWTNTTKLTKLWPSTEYECARIGVHEQDHATVPNSPIRFRTFPDSRLPTGSHFRFVVSSCLKPNFPYAPFQNGRIKGFDLLADYLFLESAVIDTPGIVEPVSVNDNMTESPIPLERNVGIEANGSVGNVVPATILEPERVASTEFMLFLGDFIYADIPIYHGDSKHAYRRLYRQNYNSPSFRKIYERLPIIHTYDDHEIINNYFGQSNDTPPFANAEDAFRIYNAEGNYDAHVSGQHYYDFRYGDVAFFVTDSRRYRSNPFTGETATRTMLGEAQLSALYEWLGKVNQTATFKFIITSVPFTSLWTHDAQTDSWAGYASEKASLLSALHTVANVYLLSGDRHEFAAIEFNPPNEVGVGAHVVREFSTSPLSMFYVPLVRTLRAASDAIVPRTRLRIVDEESPPEEVVEEVPMERVLKYLPIGNYKWSTIEIDTRNPEHPKLNLEAVIDGKVAYNLPIDATPVKLRSSTALGSMVPDSIKDILDRVGLTPNRWF